MGTTHITAIMSQPSLAQFVMKRPWMMRWAQPLSNWYLHGAGYRQLGLRADDLIPEESELVQRALKRLSPKESYDRVFRMRRAFQCSLAHQLLPKTEDDTPYIPPIIAELEAEVTERQDLEAMVIN